MPKDDFPAISGVRMTMHDKLNTTLAYIKSFQKKNGYAPSVREICQGLNINSTATAFDYINKLVDMGLLKKSDKKNRALGIVAKYPKYNKEIVEVPLLGKITAGVPISAIQDLDDVFPLPIDLFKKGQLFMLKVQGDSMIKAGILNGDKIVVRQQPSCNNGDIVAAMIDGEATVKRFFKEDKRIRLQPENDAMTPIYCDNADILGLVVGLIRKM